MPRLEVREVEFNVPLGNDAGAGASKDLATWRPNLKNLQDFYYLGPSATNSTPGRGLIVKALDLAAIGEIERWEQVWSDAGSGKPSDYSLWRAVPKDAQNYVVVGSFFIRSKNAPTGDDTQHLAAIHRSIVTLIRPGAEIWTDAGSGASKKGAVWSLTASLVPGAVDTGAFVAVQGHRNPPPLEACYGLIKDVIVFV